MANCINAYMPTVTTALNKMLSTVETMYACMHMNASLFVVSLLLSVGSSSNDHRYGRLHNKKLAFMRMQAYMSFTVKKDNHFHAVSKFHNTLIHPGRLERCLRPAIDGCLTDRPSLC